MIPSSEAARPRGDASRQGDAWQIVITFWVATWGQHTSRLASYRRRAIIQTKKGKTYRVELQLAVTRAGERGTGSGRPATEEVQENSGENTQENGLDG